MVDEIRSETVDGPGGLPAAPRQGAGAVPSWHRRGQRDDYGGEVWEINWPDGSMDLWFHAPKS